MTGSVTIPVGITSTQFISLERRKSDVGHDADMTCETHEVQPSQLVYLILSKRLRPQPLGVIGNAPRFPPEYPTYSQNVRWEAVGLGSVKRS